MIGIPTGISHRVSVGGGSIRIRRQASDLADPQWTSEIALVVERRAHIEPDRLVLGKPVHQFDSFKSDYVGFSHAHASTIGKEGLASPRRHLGLMHKPTRFTGSAMLDAAELELEDESTIEEAFYLWKDSAADFADCLIEAR